MPPKGPVSHYSTKFKYGRKPFTQRAQPANTTGEPITKPAAQLYGRRMIEKSSANAVASGKPSSPGNYPELAPKPKMKREPLASPGPLAKEAKKAEAKKKTMPKPFKYAAQRIISNMTARTAKKK